MKSYKQFYFIQNCLKSIPFNIGIKLRRTFYKPYFKYFGEGINIYENVHFKFPSDIIIGNNVQISQQCIFAGGSGLTIGNDVMFGAGTKIATSTHNHKDLNIPMRLQGISFKPVVIEDDVWFGFNCVVLQGTKISKGMIVGANSVVTGGEFEPYSFIAGVPARVIKSRIQQI